MDGKFKLHSAFAPKGDQPQAIDKLVAGIEQGMPCQTLVGVTGSGKTFTMANVIAKTQKPTLIIAHNKTLAGQLATEFATFFPENAVEYFVSYYDYYQPEAYIPGRDIYIEKDSAINDEIERMRHSATSSLLERRDVIVVASVSCIYGLGSPSEYKDLRVNLREGMPKSREEVMAELIATQYVRNDFEVKRGTFRARGDVLEIYPPGYENILIRVEFFGDEIDRITEVDALTRKVLRGRTYVMIYPASHYATTKENIKRSVVAINQELEARVKELTDQGKLLEAYRLEQRTRYDMEMLLETGFCKGIENYSRFFDGRLPGTPPYTLLDFFPDDYLLMIDESHVTVPQIGAMYNGDHSRKKSLVDFGFRLPSAFDNRPLNFAEFEERMGQTIFVSATPAKYEGAHSRQTVEQIIRPTGLLDPEVEVRPSKDHMDDLFNEIVHNNERGERTLVLTLTKKMAEDLTEFFEDSGLRVRYLHSDIKTVERLEILRDLRAGEFDVLVGINLLREGLDLPEVSLIAILEADAVGMLRSRTDLIQMIGRAARNVNGRVILYADQVTDSMQQAMAETKRRRQMQEAFNREHHITPQSIKKAVTIWQDTGYEAESKESKNKAKKAPAKSKQQAMRHPSSITTDAGTVLLSQEKLKSLSAEEWQLHVAEVDQQMRKAAQELNFEEAAMLRDYLIEIKSEAK